MGARDPDDALISTLGMEKEINAFFRLTSPSVVAKLRDAFPDLPEPLDPKTVFLKLREPEKPLVNGDRRRGRLTIPRGGIAGTSAIRRPGT